MHKSFFINSLCTKYTKQKNNNPINYKIKKNTQTSFDFLLVENIRKENVYRASCTLNKRIYRFKVQKFLGFSVDTPKLLIYNYF